MSEVSPVEILEIVAGTCCKVAKGGGNIFDACLLLNASGAPIKPSDLATHIRTLCDNFPIADSLIGHWPKAAGGSVFIGDRFRTIGEFKNSLKSGQHIDVEQFGRPGFIEIYEFRTADEKRENKRRVWLGNCSRRATRLLSDWSI